MNGEEMLFSVSESQSISLIYALTCACTPQWAWLNVLHFQPGSGKLGMCGGRDRAQYLQ
jgi:hypothetical protein